jgi:heme-degrading monooxygenase HmoA
MSHLTNVKTYFQNTSYLEKALNRLKIKHKSQQKIIDKFSSSHVNLVIPQLNGYDIKFSWNDQEYEIVIDTSFWDQDSSIENFINKIAQQYASELVTDESHEMGFQPIKDQQNSDGSNILIFQRWNGNY